MEIPCRQDKQDKQQTRNNKRKQIKTSLLPPSVVPLSTEKDKQVVHAVAPTTLPSDNPITTVTAVTPDRSAITRPSLSTNHSTKSQYSCFNDTAQYFIDVSLLLDFMMCPQPNLKLNATSEFIPILPPTTNKQASENMKWMMVATISDLGISKLCKNDRLKICKAVAHLESYYAGYTEAIATAATVLNWYYDFQRAKLNKVGLARSDIFKPTFDHPNYIDEIETLLPGYLHTG
jgi:hypothetical protein